jgi:hypothetical protein
MTNGNRVFFEGDGRSIWARRWQDLVAMHIEDVGGMENASTSQFALCKRTAAMEVELERMEAQMSGGAEIDLDLYTRLSGHFRRMLERCHRRRIPVSEPPKRPGGGLQMKPRRDDQMGPIRTASARDGSRPISQYFLGKSPPHKNAAKFSPDGISLPTFRGEGGEGGTNILALMEFYK